MFDFKQLPVKTENQKYGPPVHITTKVMSKSNVVRRFPHVAKNQPKVRFQKLELRGSKHNVANPTYGELGRNQTHQLLQLSFLHRGQGQTQQ